jgi:Effector protein
MPNVTMLPPCELTRYRGIAVADGGTPKFMSLVEKALETIGSRSIGAGLLRSIANDGPHHRYKVVISDARVSNAPIFTDSFGVYTPGVGSIAGISWHPFVAWQRDRRELADPGFLALAHELIHARRMLLGIESLDWRISEIHTIGLNIPGAQEGINPNDRRGFGSITENDIRAEHGLPLRTTYYRDGLFLKGLPIQPEERSWYDASDV